MESPWIPKPIHEAFSQAQKPRHELRRAENKQEPNPRGSLHNLARPRP